MGQERPLPFARAYASVRGQIREAKLMPGVQLLVNQCALQLGISATPVREALARLSGERLVEDRERFGFFVPLLSAVELKSLLELLEMLFDRATVGSPAVPASPASEIAACPWISESIPLFRIARAAHNPMVADVTVVAIDRTAAARRCEFELFGGSTHLSALDEALLEGEGRIIRKTLREYLRTSRKRADAVAQHMAGEYSRKIARKSFE